MAQPSHRPGTQASLPAKFFVSAGSGQMLGLPGIQEIHVKITVDVEEDLDASILQKNDRATYEKCTGTVKITGRTVDFIAWANQYNAVASEDAFDDVEDIDVIAGAGTLTYEPFGEVGGLKTVNLYNSDGDPLQQVTGTPGTGEYTVVGDVITVGGAPTDTYIASYEASTAAGVPTGTKFELDFSVRPRRCSRVWIGGYTIDPSSTVQYTGDKAEILELKNVVFHGDMPLYDSQIAQMTYELPFTGNIWKQDDLLHYMPQEPEAPTV